MPDVASADKTLSRVASAGWLLLVVGFVASRLAWVAWGVVWPSVADAVAILVFANWFTRRVAQRRGVSFSAVLRHPAGNEDRP
jgi:hypothetical protein